VRDIQRTDSASTFPMALVTILRGVATGLALVAVVLSIVSLATSWYSVNQTYSANSVSFSGSQVYDWSKVTLTYSQTGLPSQTILFYWNTNCTGSSQASVCNSDVYNAFKAALALTIIGLIASVLFLVFSLTGLLQSRMSSLPSLFGSKLWKYAAVVTAGLAALVLFIAFIQFVAGVPAGFKNHWNDGNDPQNQIPCQDWCTSFSGSNSTCPNGLPAGASCSITWGGNTGWSLAVTSFVLAAVGAIVSTVVVCMRDPDSGFTPLMK